MAELVPVSENDIVRVWEFNAERNELELSRLPQFYADDSCGQCQRCGKLISEHIFSSHFFEGVTTDGSVFHGRPYHQGRLINGNPRASE